MIDTDRPGGASIEVPGPVEIPPQQDPIGIPVPHDVPVPNDPPPERNDPLLP